MGERAEVCWISNKQVGFHCSGVSLLTQQTGDLEGSGRLGSPPAMIYLIFNKQRENERYMDVCDWKK